MSPGQDGPGRAARPFRLFTAADLAASDARLLASLDATFAEAGRLSGPALVCDKGCNECCIGPFPVTRLDAWRLRRGLADFERSDPGAARRLGDRAADACSRLSDGFPGNPATGRLSGDDRTIETFLQRHAALPCPVLDPDTGACLLYGSRPVSCRTFGPPARIGDDDLPHCRLCYVGVPAASVESCRVAPDSDGIEESLLGTLEREEDWETLIAFALTGDPA